MTEVHHWGGETRTIAVEGGEISIVVCKNATNRCSGLTFILGAANIPLSKYSSIKDTLLSINNVVVGIYVNVLSIKQGVSHRKKAKNVREVYDQLKKEFNVSKYNIVSHSIGGKIALLAAALYDEDKSIKSIIALDPVDQTPSEFTKLPPKGKKVNPDNLSLLETVTDADIIMTVTESGFFISKNHNARAIHKNNRLNNKIKLISHRNATHMAYCDEKEGGYSWKAVMEVGTGGEAAERNRNTRNDALEIIKNQISGKQIMNVSGVTKKTGKTMKDFGKGLKNSLNEIKGDVKNVTSGTANKFLMKNMLKSVAK